jgi:hypothetical protein
MPTKQQRHEAIRERARAAIADLYHNATPHYPSCDDEDEAQEFEGWFQHTAEFEVEYLQGGGTYGRDFLATLKRTANGGKFQSERARRYYVTKGIRAVLTEREKYAMWEHIGSYGTLHQWGRGGRTLAPTDLVKQLGGSGFALREDYCEDSCIANTVRLIRVIESFNAYVAAWCKSVPEMWTEEKSLRVETA